MNKRSIFVTLFCFAGDTMRALTVGVAGATGRSRQPPATTDNDMNARAPKSALRRMRPELWGRVIVAPGVGRADMAIR